MHRPPPAPKHRWIARGLVLGLHAAVLLAIWAHKTPRDAAPGERRLTTVRLLLPQPTRQAMPTPVAPRVPPAARLTPAPRPLADSPPADTPSPIAAPEPAPAAAAAPPEAPPQPPRMTLRLTLPPGYAASSAAARNPALDDPRSNTPRLTLEDRIADATGGNGAWVEEQTSDNRNQAVGALGEHRTVMRRGNTCVEIFKSRIADTDPFNGNVAPRAPRMMGKPYKCR